VRERVTVTLDLVLGGKAHAIPGGNLRGLSLEMSSWGVEGWVDFVIQNDQGRSGQHQDDVLADFEKPDLAEVQLSLTPAHLDTGTQAADATLRTGGVVLGRWLREDVHEKGRDAAALISRRYRVSFADPARALWRQHFPCDLFTNKSFQQVIEAHKGAKATLTYDLDAISAAAPLVFFHLDPEQGASFYDLVLWYVQKQQGVFTFDHAARTYSIKKAKDTAGAAATLNADDLVSMTSVFPDVPRHKPRVLCSYTEAIRTDPVDNPNAAAGVFRDLLVRTPIAKEVDDRVALEKSRPLLPGREVELTFRRFPTISMMPGSLVSISPKGGHVAARLLSPDPWRVFQIRLEGSALDQGPERTYGDTAVDLDLSITARLEAQAEPAQRLPPFVAPTFPGHLEGKIVSAVGPDGDVTYDLDQDPNTSVERYKIAVPLFAGQQIFAPYEPASGSGTLYLPLYKGERVLVGLELDRAWVERLLDWRADARVPRDGQGQHLFLGKSAQSNTSMRHDYQGDKPVLRLLRTNEKDTVLMQLEEGKLTLKVQETKG
jgi:hypothetical protein